MSNDNQKTAEFSAQEKTLIEYIRKVGYGQMLITIKDGKPCHIEEIHKSIPIK